MRYGAWDQRDFETAIKTYFGPPSPPYICYSHAGGWYNGEIVFDRDDVAYTVVHARPSNSECGHGTGRFAVLLLYSSSYGDTWQILELKPLGKTWFRFALERPYSPEPLEGLPAVLL